MPQIEPFAEFVVIESEWTGIACGVVSLLLLAAAYRRIRGTTLAAPWAWSVVAVLAVTLHEIAVVALADSQSGLWSSSLGYAMAVLALCPTIAILGAKRPQDRAWQAVVAAFAAVMLLPAAIALGARGGSAIELHKAQAIFLATVNVMGLVNWIATRYAVAVVTAAAAQGALLWPYVFSTATEPRTDMALLMTLVALVAYYVIRSRPRADAMQTAWLAFRDQYGLFWAARVQARFNAAATSHDWRVRLTWRGGAPVGNDANPAAQRSLRMLLRRFVSDEWLARHWRGASVPWPDE